MTTKHGTNDLNEELPEEHEVMQRGLGESSDKLRKHKTPVKNSTTVQKPDGSRLAADSSSTGEAEKDKSQ